MNIQPVGFLVITENTAKMIPVNHCSAIDKLLDYVPEALEKITEVCCGDRTYTYEFYEDEDGDDNVDESDNENDSKNETQKDEINNEKKDEK